MVKAMGIDHSDKQSPFRLQVPKSTLLSSLLSKAGAPKVFLVHSSVYLCVHLCLLDLSGD